MKVNPEHEKEHADLFFSRSTRKLFTLASVCVSKDVANGKTKRRKQISKNRKCLHNSRN